MLWGSNAKPKAETVSSPPNSLFLSIIPGLYLGTWLDDISCNWFRSCEQLLPRMPATPGPGFYEAGMSHPPSSFPFQMMLKIYWMPYYNITLVRAWLPNHRVEEKRYQPGKYAFNCRVRKTFCTKYCTFWSSLFCTVAKLSLIEFHMWMWSRSTKRQYKYKLFKMVL